MTYFSGSAITRQEHSIRGDIQTVDCDASKKDPSKYYEMYWKVKGAEEIGYCNPKRIGMFENDKFSGRQEDSGC